MKYQVSYMSGGGTEYPDGIWTRKDTPKTITVEKIEGDGVYHNHEVGFKAKIGTGTGNPMRDLYGDESFTVYFKQAGTPYFFEPIK